MLAGEGGGICVSICKEKGRGQTRIVRLIQSEDRKTDEGQISALLYLTSCSLV